MYSKNDDELMIRYQREHDIRALEQLFTRHKDALLRYIMRLAGDRAIAEDVSQQSWLKVIEVAQKGTYVAHSGAAFRTWLFTLARNHLIDEHQRKAHNTEPFNPGAHAGVVLIDPAEQAIQHDLITRVSSAWALLPALQRDVIALWAAGYSPQEIATMLKAPRQTVLSRKKYALAKLRCGLVTLHRARARLRRCAGRRS
jgi:RNA polymerase sigma-70 factor, ECF subfamily